MSERGPHVFISYHRADLAIAEQVRAHLIANRITTWMDHYDIPAGAYWPDEIDKGLGRSDFVIGVLSPDAADSRNVKNEWDWALQNGKSLILLQTRTCVIPHRYVSINFIDATGSDQSRWLDMLMLTAGLRPAAPKFRIPQTRYALSNGLSVAWQEFGSGEIDLVYVPGFISHVEHGWKSPDLAEHLTRFGTLARILKFDKRGTGMSDRSAGIPTPEERMDDIRAVMDAAGSERAVLYGFSQGAPLSVLFAATYPERTRGIIFYGGSATYVSRPDYPWQKSLEQWQAEIAEEEATFHERWGTMEMARETLRHYGPSRANDEAEVAFWAEYARLAASPGAVIALDRMDLEVDVRGILGAIRVPTLVLHRIGELDADIGEARYVAAHIPGAVLRELPGDDHMAHYGDQDAFFAAIEEFLATLNDETAVDTEPESVLATVVRVVAAGRDPVNLRTDLDQLLERFRGRLISEDGNGCLAVFDGPARAIRFAHAVIGLAPGNGGTMRAGVQSGEVVLRDGSIAGRPVEIATSLADLASPGQILATGTVRDLVAGSGIRFQDASADQAAGIPDGPLLLTVDWESIS
jgi:pimeloyl-ACP methyl ester carboxylesterase